MQYFQYDIKLHVDLLVLKDLCGSGSRQILL